MNIFSRAATTLVLSTTAALALWSAPANPLTVQGDRPSDSAASIRESITKTDISSASPTIDAEIFTEPAIFVGLLVIGAITARLKWEFEEEDR